MIVTAALIVAALIVAILVYAATKPSTFRYERSAAIKAAPEAIYPLINDLRSHGSWNPFDQDPTPNGISTVRRPARARCTSGRATARPAPAASRSPNPCPRPGCR